jgi:hypothetical protein
VRGSVSLIAQTGKRAKSTRSALAHMLSSSVAARRNLAKCLNGAGVKDSVTAEDVTRLRAELRLNSLPKPLTKRLRRLGATAPVLQILGRNLQGNAAQQLLGRFPASLTKRPELRALTRLARRLGR